MTAEEHERTLAQQRQRYQQRKAAGKHYLASDVSRERKRARDRLRDQWRQVKVEFERLCRQRGVVW